MAKHLFIVIILAMGVFFFLGVVFQILHNRKKPSVRYLCNKCGDHDCNCSEE
jgi:hypothetical protein